MMHTSRILITPSRTLSLSGVVLRSLSSSSLQKNIPSRSGRLQETKNAAAAAANKVKLPRQRNRLDVAIVGLPNAGKSQLLNIFTQTTVSAVSRKRHTTRKGIQGVRTILQNNSDGIDAQVPTQIVFCDTPGFLKKEQARGDGVDADLVLSSMDHVDYTLLVVDAARYISPNADDKDAYKDTLIALMRQATQAEGRVEFAIDGSNNDDDDDDDEPSQCKVLTVRDTQPVLSNKFAIVLNKVDLVHPKNQLLETAEIINNIAEAVIRYNWSEENLDNDKELDEVTLYEKLMPTFFYTSALKNDGVDDVLNHLVKISTPCEAWEVDDPNQRTTLEPEERVEEVIREKIYRCLHKEVPYQIRQVNRVFKVGKVETPPLQTTKQSATSANSNSSDNKLGLFIYQDLLVQTASHRDLVHGRNGRTLEVIRSTAERDLKRIFQCPVMLRLHVKLVRSKSFDWSI